MSSPIFNTTADFIKSALFEEYYECFDAVITGFNWSLTYSLLFAKNVVDNITGLTTQVPDPVILQPSVTPDLSSSCTLKSDAKSFVPTKSKKVKTIESNADATHIITGYRPNLSLGQYVCDILIYNIPAKEVVSKPMLKNNGLSRSVITDSNCVPIRSLLKDSGKSSIGHKLDEKTKTKKTKKKPSDGPSLLKKLSKKQLHAEIVKIKKVLLDFIQKQSQN
ncbi:hypothetical protein RCL_jg15605.t1 [Rhizophagus clarus]|uniref:Uncharacterized protein n=1 Tax=Rhizophagus clarus TaxID=94130 RepID=A0A8H3KRW3_9GLOM|nr:hypothetical protein RCL_jg15605.t1 [Rhizophagus clarus]